MRTGPSWRRLQAAQTMPTKTARSTKNGRTVHGRKSSSLSLTHGAGRFKACANGEGKVLPSAHALLPGDDDARDEAEPHLGDDKPWPVDPFTEHRVQETHKAMDQA